MSIDVPLLLLRCGREDEIALLNDHEEEQAINETQQVFVVVAGGQPVRLTRLRAELRCLRMCSGSRSQNREWQLSTALLSPSRMRAPDSSES